jgi:glycyl-tRNA synthetase alpha subunit
LRRYVEYAFLRLVLYAQQVNNVDDAVLVDLDKKRAYRSDVSRVYRRTQVVYLIVNKSYLPLAGAFDVFKQKHIFITDHNDAGYSLNGKAVILLETVERSLLIYSLLHTNQIYLVAETDDYMAKIPFKQKAQYPTKRVNAGAAGTAS